MTLFGEFDFQVIADGRHDVAPQEGSAELFLTEADIGDGWLHPRASNYTFVVQLTLYEKKAFGVYKPAKGEVPLWDFPVQTLYRRECAAYQLNSLLGWGLVPATVERDGEAGIGSLQLYVPPMPQSDSLDLKQTHSEELFRIALFDVLSNNADRKAGHCLLGPDSSLWCVDNALTFHTQYKLRTVLWDFAGQKIPGSLQENIRRLVNLLDQGSGNGVSALRKWIDEDEIQALRHRADLILKHPEMPYLQSRKELPWPLF